MDVLIDNKANICPIGSGAVWQFDDQPLSNALLPDDLVHNYGYVRFRIGVAMHPVAPAHSSMACSTQIMPA